MITIDYEKHSARLKKQNEENEKNSLYQEFINLFKDAPRAKVRHKDEAEVLELLNKIHNKE